MRTLFLLTLLCTPTVVLAQETNSQKPEEKEPSLAELARRERARKAKLKKIPVITNATVKNARGRIGGATNPELAETGAIADMSVGGGASTFDGHPMKGDQKARLTMIEFTDYQ